MSDHNGSNRPYHDRDGWTCREYVVDRDHSEHLDQPDTDPETRAEWETIGDDTTEAQWIRLDHEYDALHDRDQYIVTIEQTIASDDYRTTITTHQRHESSLDDAIDAVGAYMDGVDAGEHTVRCLGTDVWRQYVQFYCISDSDCAGDLSAAMLIDAVDESSSYEVTAADVSGEEEPVSTTDDLVVTVDIYPRHTSVVEMIGDEGGGDDGGGDGDGGTDNDTNRL